LCWVWYVATAAATAAVSSAGDLYILFSKKDI